jgi:hypothetical protein
MVRTRRSALLPLAAVAVAEVGTTAKGFRAAPAVAVAAPATQELELQVKETTVAEEMAEPQVIIREEVAVAQPAAEAQAAQTQAAQVVRELVPQ